MTKQEFFKHWNESVDFSGFPSTIETPETMTFEEFAEGESFRYEDEDSLYLKIKDDDDEWRVVLFDGEKVKYL